MAVTLSLVVNIREYITGFSKRKEERKQKAKNEIEAKAKQERRDAKIRSKNQIGNAADVASTNATPAQLINKKNRNRRKNKPHTKTKSVLSTIAQGSYTDKCGLDGGIDTSSARVICMSPDEVETRGCDAASLGESLYETGDEGMDEGMEDVGVGKGADEAADSCRVRGGVVSFEGTGDGQEDVLWSKGCVVYTNYGIENM
eukprot:GHVQ01015169.1.p1 GENE.GHVQ01015169.1~~GHVQ01015169.1.p1  ORF type:complete len:201 (+),score=43.43 GHVQ01015169.1:635-1237(+)